MSLTFSHPLIPKEIYRLTYKYKYNRYSINKLDFKNNNLYFYVIFTFAVYLFLHNDIYETIEKQKCSFLSKHFKGPIGHIHDISHIYDTHNDYQPSSW